MGRFAVEGREWQGTFTEDAARSGERTWPLDAVRLLAPVRPSKIVCLGRNYDAHAREFGHKVPSRPLLFLKPPSAILAPEEPILLPEGSRVDFEGELAVVIGRRCRRVSPAAAADVILGYTCLNDVTDRDAQSWERNWVRAKGFDTSCPLGPWVVSADELSFPLVLETRVNRTVRQQASTDTLLVGIAEAIAEISAFMTLEPQDVIATGTPSGVGPLAPGDRVEIKVSGIGSLANPVGRANQQ